MTWNPESIKRMREHRGLTQGDLAQISGYSQSMISRIELRQSEARYIQRIVEVLQAQPIQLYTNHRGECSCGRVGDLQEYATGFFCRACAKDMNV